MDMAHESMLSVLLLVSLAFPAVKGQGNCLPFICYNEYSVSVAKLRVHLGWFKQHRF